MSLDKDTSEELGLDSRPSRFDKYRRSKSNRAACAHHPPPPPPTPPPPPQVVEVDLLAERFSEGKPSRERLQWCITDRLALEMDFVLCCNSSDGNAVTGVSSNPFIATVRRGPVLQLHGCREASLSESHQSAGGTPASSTAPL